MSVRVRRTFGSAPSFLPLAGLSWTWYHLGEPMHRNGFYTVLGLGVLGAILMPGIVVSARELPKLLIPAGMRAAWRHGRPRPSIRAYLRRAIMAADRYRCCWCHSPDDLQIDHIKPWSVGGLTALWNTAVLCAYHNQVKSNYWRDRDGYIHYRPFNGTGNVALAAEILSYERRHRWSVLRWLRAGWALTA